MASTLTDAEVLAMQEVVAEKMWIAVGGARWNDDTPEYVKDFWLQLATVAIEGVKEAVRVP